jgi:quinohemoprotein ethanol dehydrogenase
MEQTHKLTVSQWAWHSDVLGSIGSGTLSTAGGLVFQGTHKGRLVAYAASDGRELWSMDAQTGVVSAPSTFEIDGEQYLAKTVGYGLVPYGQSNHSRLLVLKLGGTAHLPPLPPAAPPPVLDPPPSTAAADVIEAGKGEFQGHCAMCHETQYANRSVFPDLRYSALLRSAEGFRAVVLEGALAERGMAPFNMAPFKGGPRPRHGGADPRLPDLPGQRGQGGAATSQTPHTPVTASLATR